MRIIVPLRLRQLITPGLTLAMRPAAAVSPAGVIDSLKTVDNLTIYLGAVTAAVEAHSRMLTELLMHGRALVRRLHVVHLVAYVFGVRPCARITKANFIVDIVESGGKLWSVLGCAVTDVHLRRISK
jgi:hypothetical protein